MMTNKQTYISPETTLIALQGVRSVMTDDEIPLSASGTMSEAPLRIPSHNLYL